MDTIKLHVVEVCEWLCVTPEQLRQLRRRRDATKFPPPCGPGLVWIEQDVVHWVSFLADWRDAGSTRDALDELTPPTYLAAEPETMKERA